MQALFAFSGWQQQTDRRRLAIWTVTMQACRCKLFEFPLLSKFERL